MLHARLVSDLSSKLLVLIYPYGLTLMRNYIFKLHVLIYSFAACHKCKANSKSYTLQTRLVHSCMTYALTWHARVHCLQPMKDGNYFCKAGIDQKIKDKWSTISCLSLSPPISLLTFVPAHLPRTINSPLQAMAPSDASPAI